MLSGLSRAMADFRTYAALMLLVAVVCLMPAQSHAERDVPSPAANIGSTARVGRLHPRRSRMREPSRKGGSMSKDIALLDLAAFAREDLSVEAKKKNKKKCTKWANRLHRVDVGGEGPQEPAATFRAKVARFTVHSKSSAPVWLELVNKNRGKGWKIGMQANKANLDFTYDRIGNMNGNPLIRFTNNGQMTVNGNIVLHGGVSGLRFGYTHNKKGKKEEELLEVDEVVAGMVDKAKGILHDSGVELEDDTENHGVSVQGDSDMSHGGDTYVADSMKTSLSMPPLSLPNTNADEQESESAWSQADTMRTCIRNFNTRIPRNVGKSILFTSHHQMAVRVVSERSSDPEEVYMEMGASGSKSWGMGMNDQFFLDFAYGRTGTMNKGFPALRLDHKKRTVHFYGHVHFAKGDLKAKGFPQMELLQELELLEEDEAVSHRDFSETELAPRTRLYSTDEGLGPDSYDDINDDDADDDDSQQDYDHLADVDFLQESQDSDGGIWSDIQSSLKGIHMPVTPENSDDGDGDDEDWSNWDSDDEAPKNSAAEAKTETSKKPKRPRMMVMPNSRVQGQNNFNPLLKFKSTDADVSVRLKGGSAAFTEFVRGDPRRSSSWKVGVTGSNFMVAYGPSMSTSAGTFMKIDSRNSEVTMNGNIRVNGDVVLSWEPEPDRVDKQWAGLEYPGTRVDAGSKTLKGIFGGNPSGPGIRSVKITLPFKRAFAVPPPAVVNLRMIDCMASSNCRVDAEILSVDEAGIKLQLSTWARSTVKAVGITWMAVGQDAKEYDNHKNAEWRHRLYYVNQELNFIISYLKVLQAEGGGSLKEFRRHVDRRQAVLEVFVRKLQIGSRLMKKMYEKMQKFFKGEVKFANSEMKRLVALRNKMEQVVSSIGSMTPTFRGKIAVILNNQRAFANWLRFKLSEEARKVFHKLRKRMWKRWVSNKEMRSEIKTLRYQISLHYQNAFEGRDKAKKMTGQHKDQADMEEVEPQRQFTSKLHSPVKMVNVKDKPSGKRLSDAELDSMYKEFVHGGKNSVQEKDNVETNAGQRFSMGDSVGNSQSSQVTNGESRPRKQQNYYFMKKDGLMCPCLGPPKTQSGISVPSNCDCDAATTRHHVVVHHS